MRDPRFDAQTAHVDICGLISKESFQNSIYVWKFKHLSYRKLDDNQFDSPAPMVHEIMPEICRLIGWNIPELLYGTNDTFISRQNWKYSWRYESRNPSTSLLCLWMERYYCEDGKNRYQEGMDAISQYLEIVTNLENKELLEELRENIESEWRLIKK